MSANGAIRPDVHDLADTLLGQTLPAHAFSAAETLRLHRTLGAMAQGTDSRDLAVLLASTLADTPPLSEDLPPLRLIEEDLNAQSLNRRYSVHGILGRGSHGIVYAATDHDLDREVAVKVLRPDLARNDRAVERFTHEARIAASLDHPGILPIYDYDLGERGTIWYSMRRAEGVSLETALTEARAGRVHPALAGLDARIEVFRRACDAVAYAHHRGIVHQDLKPANILLGSFGEVTVVDWGSAFTRQDRDSGRLRLMGTPLYLAPEQARRERADARSDVFALGGTLLQILTLRPPLAVDGFDRFWERKRGGEIDGPTARERRGWPKPLLSILRQACAADPSARYADAGALAEDLARLRQGEAVRAHREGPAELLARFWRRHRRGLLATAAALFLLTTTTGLLVREKLKERSSWSLLDREDFSDPATLGTRWRLTSLPDWDVSQAWEIPVGDPHIRIVDGRLELRAQGGGYDCVNVAWTGEVPEDLAVEWSVTPLVDVVNENVFIGGRDRAMGYTFHIGGFGERDQVVLTRGRSILRLAAAAIPAAVRPQVGKRTHGRVEKQGDRLRLWLDRVLILDVIDPEALVGPEFRGFGFECGANRLLIDDIRIEHLPLPEKIDPIVVAHGFFSRGDFAVARASYRQIHQAYPGTEMARTARYREARCLDELGDHAGALALLERVIRDEGGTRLGLHAQLAAVAILLDDDDLEAATPHLHALGRPAVPELIRQAAAERVDTYLDRRFRLNDRMAVTEDDLIERIEACRTMHVDWYQRLGLQPYTDRVGLMRRCAAMLNRLGRHDLVLERFSGESAAYASALVRLGRMDEALAHFADDPGMMRALLGQAGRHRDLLTRFGDDDQTVKGVFAAEGRFEEALRRFPDDEGLHAAALFSQGRYQEILERFPRDRRNVGQALLALGRYEEILGRFPHNTWVEYEALLALDRPEEVIARTHPLDSHHVLALALIAVRAARDGDTAACLATLARIETIPILGDTPPLARCLLPPFLRWCCGGDRDVLRDDLRQLAADLQPRFPGFSTVALILAGDTPVTELSATQQDRSLLLGMAAEIAGDTEAARAAYRDAATSLPHHLIHPMSRWRLDHLGGAVDHAGP